MIGEGCASKIEGRVALVTGASSGLGRHFARVLAANGAKVIVAARRIEPLTVVSDDIVAQGGWCRPVVLDVTDPASVKDAFAAIEVLAEQSVDILVNNAGVAKTRAAIDVSPAEWGAVLTPNLTGSFLVAQAAAIAMRGRGGSIVNVASILGERVAKGVAAYAASKAGLIQLTKALALEWASIGVRVNALAPGYIETDLNQEFFASEAGKRLIDRIPQRRLGRMEDLDGPLLLLCSDASRYMTGTVIAIDGGHLVSGL